MQRMERRWSQLTREDVQALANNAEPAKYAYGGQFSSGPWMPEESDTLCGRSFLFNFDDGTYLNYRFTAKNTLYWSENGSAEREEFVQVCLAPGCSGLYFVNHFCKGSTPPRAMILVIDDERGLVTVCDSHIGVPNSAIEVGRTFRFGRIDGSDSKLPLHDYTNDLVGKAIIWNYGNNAPDIKHIYTMPKYYTYTMVNGDKCWAATNPADYIKIRENMYIFSFVEERQAGLQSIFLINMDELHDVGAFFGISTRGLSCKLLGAKGKLSTMYTIC